MPAHLLATIVSTFLSAANIYSDAIWNIFTSRSTSTSSAFEVFTVNAQYKSLITYLLVYWAHEACLEQKDRQMDGRTGKTRNAAY